MEGTDIGVGATRGGTAPAEVGFLNAVMGARSPAAAESVVNQAFEGVLGVIEDQGQTQLVRRKMLAVAESRLSLLERVLDDPMIDPEKRARLLLKTLEIGIRVPSASIEGEGEGRTLRVRIGGGGA